MRSAGQVSMSGKPTAWLVGLILLLSFPLEAALIVEFDFDNPSGRLSPSGGTQQGTAPDLALGPGTASFPNRAGNGQALQISGGLFDYRNRNFRLQVTGTNLKDFSVTYVGNADFFTSQTWSYSTDGTNYSSANITQPGALLGSGFTSYTVDFSNVVALNGADSVFLQNSLTPTFLGASTVRFDDLAVRASPIPEPTMLFAWGAIATTSFFRAWFVRRARTSFRRRRRFSFSRFPSRRRSRSASSQKTLSQAQGAGANPAG